MQHVRVDVYCVLIWPCPDAAGGERGYEAAKPDAVIHSISSFGRRLFSSYVTAHLTERLTLGVLKQESWG
jgi:hypothetical protein